MNMRHPAHGFLATLFLQLLAYLLPISLEWKAAFFLVSIVIFIIYRLDGRFFILAALLHLWYCPFMLVAGKQAYAETSAIYAYYYLVTGVLAQIIERWRPPQKTDFNYFLREVIKSRVWREATFIILIILAVVYFLHMEGQQFRILLLLYILSICLAAVLMRISMSPIKNPKLNKKAS